MFNESNARSKSISLGSANRRGLGWELKEYDSPLSPKYAHGRHDLSGATGSKRIGLTWVLIILLLLLVTYREKQIVVDNFLPTAGYGLYACGGLLTVIRIAKVWIHGYRTSRRYTVTEHIAGLFDINKLVVFLKAHLIPVILLVGAAIVRVCLQVVFIRIEQCMTSGIESLVPLAYVGWRNWRKQANGRLEEVHPGNKGFQTSRRGVGVGPDVQVAVFLGLSIWTGSHMLTYPRSTVICESSLASWFTALQLLSVALDACIMTLAETCLGLFPNFEISPLSGLSLLTSVVCFVSAPLVLIFSLLFKLVQGMEVFSSLDSYYYKAFSWELLIVLVNVLLIGRLLSSGRTMTLFLAFAGVHTASCILSALSNRNGISFTDCAQALLAFGALFAAFINNSEPRGLRGELQSSASTSKYVFYCLLGAAMCITLLGMFPNVGGVDFLQDHPIDALIYSAEQAHEAWAMQAKQSETLQEAVTNYQKRYKRQPPPNFHIWYYFAIARNSDVIDDFDNIERDLAPFRKLSPANLRERIREAVEDPFNEIGVIKIRGGKAVVDKRFEGHSWMMDVMVLMIEYFTLSLPDMDIPFNINDEPRVVVPYDEMQALLSKKLPDQSTSASKNWSSNTGELLDQPFKDDRRSTFESWSFKNNFKRYSTLACAPTDAARRSRSWLSTRFCFWCAEPHSISHFVEDWNQAGNPCHQPDLANLHGFYQGPGSYKVTKKLLPVFSASKLQGYADILYPSIWGWDDGQRVKYSPNKDYPAPDYANKSTTLFWRGHTAEGFAISGKWRTFSRQRFVYMTNNGGQSLPMYLPNSGGSDRYKIEHLTKDQLLDHASLKGSGLTTDTGFTSFYKAWDDREYEMKVFGTIEAEDFQANWQHKYLMSLDEDSASKSFIPLVQSNCLPFRASIFHEWFDDRLIAWKHFVPIDLRFQGLWSTLAYFAGKFGTIRSIEGMDAGEFIAESGRLWGSRTLRKDDMEIYLFRLLLEWGRLLDDQRDEVGYQL